MNDVWLGIWECPIHSQPAICVDPIGVEMAGQRLTPGKCCGRWDLVRRWRVSASRLIEQITEEATAEEEE